MFFLFPSIPCLKSFQRALLLRFSRYNRFDLKTNHKIDTSTTKTSSGFGYHSILPNSAIKTHENARTNWDLTKLAIFSKNICSTRFIINLYIGDKWPNATHVNVPSVYSSMGSGPGPGPIDPQGSRKWPLSSLFQPTPLSSLPLSVVGWVFPVCRLQSFKHDNKWVLDDKVW